MAPIALSTHHVQKVWHKQVDKEMKEGFLPYLYKEGKQANLAEILQARRRGKTLSNNSRLSQGMSNQGADDDTVFESG